MHAWILSLGGALLLGSLLIAAAWTPFIWSLVVIVPLLLIAVYDRLQANHAIRRNFPLIGRGRWFMEFLGPFVRQYFIETDTGGTPISRMFRSVVYQRAKGVMDSVPFGTRVDTQRVGYEWIGHSLSALDVKTLDEDFRVTIGGPFCQQPYSASILNISAMSFGALSRNARPVY